MQDENPAKGRSEREIFFEALDKATPEERAAFLDGACGQDLNLRARVEALLAGHFENDSFIQEPAVEGIPTLAIDTTPTEEPGVVVGRYKLLEKLGEGGFGAVWAAEQREPVKRRVALKIIKLGMDTRQVVARFEAERQALALMDHPNIAKVLDGGATDTGRPYFVMELVKGIPITRYCDQEKLDTNERLNLFIKVCQAIQHAHQKGIIHRDIKPSNIMITLHDGVPVPKVIDFGIAKATQQELTEKTIYTQYHQFIGTPAYMSPEQAEMSGLDIDTRSDIYSLGVLLYELLTGSTPFDTKELLKSGLDEMRKIIREREPMKPSTRLSQTLWNSPATGSLATRHSSLPIDLDWIVMKCLEKDRVRRYETANGLAADIQRHLSNEPVTAVAPTFSYQLGKFYRRNRARVRAAAAAAVLLALTTIYSAVQAIKATRAQRTAETAEQAAISANEETQIRLYRSLVEQARAVQSARRSGFRTNVWRLLKDAMSISETRIDRAELRSIAVACLDEPNRLEWRRTNSIPNAGAWSIFDLSEQHMAIGSDDGRVEVYDPVDGRLTASLTGGHSEAIASVAKLNGEDTWATSDLSGNVALWRRASGSGDWSAERHLRADGLGNIPRLLACGDGLLAYASGSSKILIWEKSDSSQPRVVQLPFQVGTGDSQETRTRSVGVSPDGRSLLAVVNAASGREVSARVWDLMAQEEAAVLSAPFPYRAFRVLFSDDGSIAVCASGKQVMVYDAREWKRLKSLRSSSWLNADNVALSRDGRVVAFGGGIKSVWNLEYDVEMSALTEAEGYPILSEDGSRLMIFRATLPEWRIERWELGRSDTMLVEEAHVGNVFGLGISPDGRHLASGGMDGHLKLWSLEPWERVSLKEGYFNSSVEDPSFSFDGRLLAVMSGPWMGRLGESQITFWDTVTKRRIRSISFGNTHGLVSFHDSQPLVAAAAGNSLGVWRYRLESGDDRADVDLQLDPIQEVTLQWPSVMVGLDPRAHYVFWSEFGENGDLGGFDRSILRAMDLETGSMLPFHQPVGSGFNEFTFMPDGRGVILAACGRPGQAGRIEIWDFLKNERLAHFAESSFPEVPTPSVMGLHPNGRHLVFQSTKNEALELWDIETQRMICRFPLPEGIVTPTGAVAGLKWSPNGELLAVPLSTGQIRIWNIPAVRRALGELGLDWGANIGL